MVLGPGTGLGVAGLIHSCGSWIPVPGEGGHMDIGPRTPRDFEVFPHIERIEAAFRANRSCAGAAWSTSTAPWRKADGEAPRFTAPAEITRPALGRTDAVAEEALELFVTCLGRTAGDLALVFKSRGGVFLTGGIAQKIVPR